MTSDKIEQFISFNNRPLISKLDNTNFKNLGELGLTMIIAVVDYGDKDGSDMVIEKLNKVANVLSPGVQDKIVFGHVDGVKWKKFLSHYNGKPHVFLCLDLASDRYLTIKPETSLEESNLYLSQLNPQVSYHQAGCLVRGVSRGCPEYP